MNTSVITQLLGEFFGTAILVLLGDGVVAGVNLKKSKSNGAGWLTVTLGWGLAVTFGVYMVSWMSPGHLNPAVTLAMAIAGKFDWALVLPYAIAQILGAIVGAVLVWLTYFPHWAETDDKDAILGSFSTEPAIRSYWANFFSELVGTFILAYGLLALSKNSFAGGLNPIAAGLLIAVIGISLGGPTGYAINPARDLGPRIAHQFLPIANKGGSDWAYSWVPVFGPLAGGIVAALLFNVVSIMS
ncbi:MIP/aquaporin family protein [Xylocopilactobacillus apis]|uniref:Glycerol uptake facilitator protein n=1 Tax=Xylocopilactobacillus apis TaxID=2932183 RepID=A0AAU9DAE0_9LACO|nr:MIP/aquaporin family protein [Xylocopilactobacillus apis]BDR56625.1 glycerol uptake facilitator protein [Xylocopilactobacillus apis]